MQLHTALIGQKGSYVLNWKKRTTRHETLVSRVRVWETKCGRFRVDFCRGKLSGMTDTYYALRVTEKGTRIISKHRTLSGAQRACQKYAAKIEKGKHEGP
jgi:hypothetical protein